MIKAYLYSSSGRTILISSFAALVFGLVGLLTYNYLSQPALAVKASDWRAGNIVDDAIFYNKNAMSVAQIQAWLNARISCDTNGSKTSEYGGGRDYNNDGKITRAEWARSYYGFTGKFICLNNYYENTSTRKSNLVTGVKPSGAVSTATIIKNAADQYNVNPQVLLVKLKKESPGPLTDDQWPMPDQFKAALGYACPDPPAGQPVVCDPAYSGFSRQVIAAAKGINSYRQYASSYRYQPFKKNVIQYNPNSACGSSSVHIENYATAGLYNYTPYQPNSAALNKMPGIGDNCSAYGNRNFWYLFNTLFGATKAASVSLKLLDGSTDTKGDTARISIALGKRPSKNVTLSFNTSPSNSSFVGSNSITITPDRWNRPDLNVVTIRGKENPDLRESTTYSVGVGKITTQDADFTRIAVSSLQKFSINHQRSDSSMPVHRLYSPTAKKHRFTTSSHVRNTLVSQGWRDEGVSFRYCESGNQPVYTPSSDLGEYFTRTKTSYANTFSFNASSIGPVPVYWNYDQANDRSLFSTNQEEGVSAGFAKKGLAFYACGDKTSLKTTPVYRLYRKSTKTHFYTSSVNERNQIIGNDFRYEGVNFYGDATKGIPVYRLYRHATKTHLYTTSTKERDILIASGKFRNEGIGFYGSSKQRVPVYRFYRHSTNTHLYTSSATEKNELTKSNDFRYEGVAFYAP